MSRRASPTLIGGFVLGALALTITTLMLLTGGEWFERRGRHVLYFKGSAQGLQVGAPVVFLGVKIGTVKQIGLGLDDKNGQFLVPVTIEVEPQPVRARETHAVDLGDPEQMRGLVDRGLRGQLRIQSLLTGQLYVDLEFHPDKPANFMGLDPAMSEIPAIPTPTEELTNRLGAFPMEKFLTDLAQIAESLKTLLHAKPTQNLPARMDAALASLESLADTLRQHSGPFFARADQTLEEMRGAIAATRSAMRTVEDAAPRVGASADRVRHSADRVAAQFEADSALMANLHVAAENLAEAARGVQALSGEQSPTVQNINRTLVELGRSARALRLLAEELEQHPEALLRGKH